MEPESTISDSAYTILLHNHIVLSKIGCLQKTGDKKVKNFGNGGDCCQRPSYFRISEGAKTFTFQKNSGSHFKS